MTKILVVDDNDQNVYMIQILLNSHGYEVMTAENGKEALVAARQERPDLIISDILMPVMDGFTLIREWKTDDSLKTIPFMFYTATYTDQKDEEYALALGADQYVRKPIDPDLFLQQIISLAQASHQARLDVQEPAIQEEEEGYKLYSARLVKKLEKKMMDLEQEIQNRKQTETELHQARQEWIDIFQSIGNPVFIIDPNYNVLRANHAAVKATQTPEQELIGRKCYDVFHNSTVPLPTCPMCQILQNKQMTTRETEIQALGGSFLLSCTPIFNPDRSLEKVIHMATDITEFKKSQALQHQLEVQLRQAQKMESIGNLAGGIAHDFNNILASIIGYTELSLADAEEGTLLKGNLEEIYHAGKRARDLIKQILTFARKTDEKIIPLQPDKIGQEVLKLLRPAAPANIDIQSEFKTAAHVMANPTQIHQVFMNLCTNAIQSMEKVGGRLRVSLWDEILDPESGVDLGLGPGNYMVLEVSDTGQGIPKNHIERIFDPYFTTKGPASGTGLGLSTVHGIVKSVGGEITVTSTENQGSVFRVYLPAIAGLDETKPRTEALVPLGNESILFVDDEPAIAEVGTLILTRLGYQVTPKTDSREALETFVASPHEFDLVITDMTMPWMTGETLARELIQVRPDIPVILLTGHHKKISQDLIQEAGIRAFAHKPLMLAQLARLVRDVLDDQAPKK